MESNDVKLAKLNELAKTKGMTVYAPMGVTDTSSYRIRVTGTLITWDFDYLSEVEEFLNKISGTLDITQIATDEQINAIENKYSSSTNEAMLDVLPLIHRIRKDQSTIISEREEIEALAVQQRKSLLRIKALEKCLYLWVGAVEMGLDPKNYSIQQVILPKTKELLKQG